MLLIVFYPERLEGRSARLVRVLKQLWTAFEASQVAFDLWYGTRGEGNMNDETCAAATVIVGVQACLAGSDNSVI